MNPFAPLLHAPSHMHGSPRGQRRGSEGGIQWKHVCLETTGTGTNFPNLPIPSTHSTAVLHSVSVLVEGRKQLKKTWWADFTEQADRQVPVQLKRAVSKHFSRRQRRRVIAQTPPPGSCPRPLVTRRTSSESISHEHLLPCRGTDTATRRLPTSHYCHSHSS
ncbi:hypothetical protein EYF80_058379 [Liparis tanakae]|uniref:Uncharacterized protein n=1 Tax=Liparis tanakae TaxID=230148 RepID=A0A4Z2ES97_9TELE|nr:hypothetical protein EYF80_058379 [Liparis tanakae]